MDFETAKILANVEFHNLHTGPMPDWLNDGVTISGFRDHEKNWSIRYSVVPASPLKANQTWEEIRGNKVIIETDPYTKKRSILISRESPAPIVIFETKINHLTHMVDVVIDSDLTTLDGSAFESYPKSLDNKNGTII